MLIDLTIIPDEELLTHRRIAALEWVLKYIRIKDLVEIVPTLLEVLDRYPLPTARIRQLFHYLIHVGETNDFPKFYHLINQQPYQEFAMTPAQYFKEEGKKEEALIIARACPQLSQREEEAR